MIDRLGWRIAVYRRLRGIDLGRWAALRSALLMQPMGAEMRRDIEEGES